MSDQALFKKCIFSPEFLSLLLRFSDLRKMLILFADVFGSDTPKEAESHMESLREELLKTAKDDEYPADYKGERTFAKNVDDIIKYLRNAIRPFLEEETESIPRL